MLELRTLFYFATACRSESLSQAAATLDISVSTLSAALKSLGADLDVSLFRRSSHNLVPTADARALMRDAEPLLLMEMFARKHVASAAGGDLRSLVVEVDFGFAIGDVSKALRVAAEAMASIYPDVLVEMQWKDETEMSPAAPDGRMSETAGSHVRINLAEQGRARQKREVVVHPDPWVFASRLPAGTRRPLGTRALTEGPIVVPMLSSGLIDQADRYFSIHKIKGVRFLRDHPGDLPRVIDEYPEAALFVPRSIASPRLGLSNVFTVPPQHPLVMDVVARPRRADAISASFIELLKAALSTNRRVRVEPPSASARQIHYFNLIHRARRISAVARTAGVSQPALSEQLHKLEEALGRPLFRRMGDGLVPTGAGDRFAVLSDMIDVGLKRISARGSARAKSQSRRVGVGVLPSVNEHGFLLNRITDAIIEVQTRYPLLSLTIQEAPNGTLQDWVVGGLVSVAVVETTLPHMPRLPLGSSEALAAIAHVKHDMLPPGPVSLVDLVPLKLILPTSRFGLRQLFDDALRSRDLRKRPFMEVNALSMAVSLLERLPVCTVLPASAVARHIEQGELVAHPIVDPAIARRLYVIYSGERPLSEFERALVKALKRKLTEIDQPPT